MTQLLASAARLQRLVPDAVLVGDTASALHAGHRRSFDHDHVVADLRERYGEILEAVAATDGWVTSVRASSPPLTLLGSLDGVKAGLRQLRRTRPLETERMVVTGADLCVPTLPEMLRVKVFLVVQRNQVRDYLDVVALAERLGPAATDVVLTLDDYYRDCSDGADAVLTVALQRLSEPSPRDHRVTRQLAAYKGLDARWHAWSAVTNACAHLADDVLMRLEAGPR